MNFYISFPVTLTIDL